MTPTRKEFLKRLARLMKLQNQSSMPVTSALLDCMDLVITPEETDFLLKMGSGPISYEQARELTTQSAADFRGFFDTLLKKGLVWPRDYDPDGNRFDLAPILVGWFELQLCGGEETTEKREFARCLDRLLNDWAKYNIFPLRSLQNYYFLKNGSPNQRITPVSPHDANKKSVKIEVKRKIVLPDDQILPSRDLHRLLKKYGRKDNIALMHCFCRQWRKLAEEPCGYEYPAESCIAIGPITAYIVRYGFGRHASVEEALEVIEKTRKAGAVHTVFYEKDDMKLPEIGICNCCPDCCGLLGSYNRGAIPLQFKCDYLAHIAHGDQCTGCEQCTTHCPVNAVSLVRQTAYIEKTLCIGCGQCASRCPEKVIVLQAQERVVKLPLKKKSALHMKKKCLKGL